MEMQNTVFIPPSEQNLEEIRSKEYLLLSNKNQGSKKLVRTRAEERFVLQTFGQQR